MVQPKNLIKINDLEKELAQISFSKTCPQVLTGEQDGTTNIADISTQTVDGESHSSEVSGNNGVGSTSEPSEKELQMHMPKIVLPTIFKKLERVLSDPKYKEEAKYDVELLHVYRKWTSKGTKKTFVKWIDSFGQSQNSGAGTKFLTQFFGEREGRIIFTDDPELEYNEDDIGENSQKFDDIMRLFGLAGKTFWEMLKNSVNNARSFVATCNKKFLQMSKKANMVTWGLIPPGSLFLVKTFIDKFPKDALQEVIKDPEIANTIYETLAIDGVVPGLGFGVAVTIRLIQKYYERKAKLEKQSKEKGFALVMQGGTM